jgi:membrane associated rhomboid family serine protease
MWQMKGRARLSWTTGTGDAESMLAEARKALFVMVGFLALLWVIQLINEIDHLRLIYDLGILPRSVSGLPRILTAPFLHESWTHIEGNSGPLFIFGFLAAYRGVVRFFGLTLLVIIGSGLADWLFAPAGTVGVGASGVVFGYLGYILVRGLVDRHVIDVIIGAVMALCFAYQFSVLLPHAGIGWQDHIGGLVSGVLGGWVFRDRSRIRRAAGPAAIPSAGPAMVPAGGTAAVPAGGTAAPATGRTAVLPGRAARQPSPGKGAATGPYPGPRADLHKELDDFGL